MSHLTHFDWIFYSNFYNDIKSAGIDSIEKAHDHYKTHGQSENRKVSFDVDKYLKNNEIYGETLFNINRNNVSLFSVNQDIITYIIKNPRLEPNSRVLEIGCNIACYSLPIIKYLKENGAYYGIESNRNCLGWCRNRIQPACQHVIFRYFNPSKFKIPEGICDLDMVYSFTIFINLAPEQVVFYLNTINRVLKKGGLLLLSLFMWNHTTPVTARSRTLKTSLIKNNGNNYLTNNYNEHATVYLDTQFYQWLEATGFEIVDTIFGSWTANGNEINESVYQDIIVATKKNL